MVRDATDSDNTVRWPYAIDRRAVRQIHYLSISPPELSTPREEK